MKTSNQAAKVREAQNYVLGYASDTLAPPDHAVGFSWDGTQEKEEHEFGNVLAYVQWLMLVTGYPRTHQYRARMNAKSNPA